MPHVTEIDVQPYDPAALKSELPTGRWDSLIRTARRFPSDATLWHINSTAAGGGVAEMLHPVIGLARTVGVTARWLVIDGPTEFFEVTKRIDNGVSGIEGDGGPLGGSEAALYERVSAEIVGDLARFVRADDRIVLHDPQTAGLCTGLRELGAVVMWRAHNGADRPNEHSVRSWDFLRRYIGSADGLIATTDDFRPPGLDALPYTSIAPFIDPTAAKNRSLTESDVLSRLERWGIIEGNSRPARVPPGYELYREGPPPTAHTPMIAQISRWDRVKDMAGVIDSFERSIAPFTDAHLTLAGPEVTGVADDPEAADYLAHCVSRWRQLPRGIRRRVQLVCLPMTDMTDNALTINALQRHAVVVTQKSRSEGFGLTVAEAMWKRTPVVATAVGGIRLQIPTPHHGGAVPLDAPDDRFGRVVRTLLDQPEQRRSIGQRGLEHIRTHFLPDTQLSAEIEFFEQLSLEVTV